MPTLVKLFGAVKLMLSGVWFSDAQYGRTEVEAVVKSGRRPLGDSAVWFKGPNN
jgi:hypothetical protein